MMVSIHDRATAARKQMQAHADLGDARVARADEAERRRVQLLPHDAQPCVLAREAPDHLVARDGLDTDDVCLGCHRTIREICDWHKASAAEKTEVLERCRARSRTSSRSMGRGWRISAAARPPSSAAPETPVMLLLTSAVPFAASGDAGLTELFPAEWLSGSYGKKFSRCLSRMEEMLGERRAGLVGAPSG